MKYKNRVKVTGIAMTEPEFVFRKNGEDVYKFWIRAQRASGANDILPVQITGSVLQGQKIREGEKYTVWGSYQSSDKFRMNGKRMLMLYINAKNLEVTDSADSNRVTLKGAVCKKPIFRIIKNKDISDPRVPREIAEVMLSVNRKSGAKDYIPVICWYETARMIRDSVDVGTFLDIQGRIQSRLYVKVLPDGTKEERVAYEVSADAVVIAD